MPWTPDLGVYIQFLRVCRRAAQAIRLKEEGRALPGRLHILTKALETHKRVVEARLSLDAKYYDALMGVVAELGRGFSSQLDPLVTDLRRRGVVPDERLYRTMIRSYGMDGRFEKIEEAIQSMFEEVSRITSHQAVLHSDCLLLSGASYSPCVWVLSEMCSQ